jgi:hypothetical protein
MEVSYWLEVACCEMHFGGGHLHCHLTKQSKQTRNTQYSNWNFQVFGTNTCKAKGNLVKKNPAGFKQRRPNHTGHFFSLTKRNVPSS